MSTPMLDPRQLTAIQALAAKVCDVPSVLQRVTRTPDGLGSYTEAWNTIGTPNCLIGPPTGAQEVALAMRIADVVSYHIALPAGTDVRPNDRLVIGARTLTVGTVYEPHSYDVLTNLFASEVR